MAAAENDGTPTLIKPVVVQYSPQSPSKQDELGMRVKLYSNNDFWPFKEGGTVIRNGRIGELNDMMKSSVQNMIEKQIHIPFIFAISGHGTKADGSFRAVEVPDTPIRWTTRCLWEGLAEFEGLKTLLKPLVEQKRMIVLLFTQCYGAKFALKLAQHAELPDNVYAVGLSDGSTMRSHNPSPKCTMGTEWIHWHYTVWLQSFQLSGANVGALTTAAEAVQDLCDAIVNRKTRKICHCNLEYSPNGFGVDEDDLDFNEEEDTAFLIATADAKDY